ncbi:MAG: hypothetical protein ACLPQS_12425 [Acidimicrobiales bacterium]
MERFARDDVSKVLLQFGIEHARRAVSTDDSEEVILLDASVYDEVNVAEVTLALMDVLPHTKVWVAPFSEQWRSELL